MNTRERSWPVPVALVVLSAIPLTARTLRLIQLTGGPALIPADHRFAGWVINLAVAGWVLRHPRSRRAALCRGPQLAGALS